MCGRRHIDSQAIGPRAVWERRSLKYVRGEALHSKKILNDKAKDRKANPVPEWNALESSSLVSISLAHGRKATESNC